MNTLNLDVPGRRTAAWVAIVSLPLAFLTQFFLATASKGNAEFLYQSHQLLALPTTDANALYWGLWLDPFGFYMIYIPVIIYAWKALRHVDESVADISSAFGIGYCLLGTFGALTQAGTYEALQGLYVATESADVREAAAAAWSATAGGQVRGLWLMEAFFAAVWLLGVARLLFAIGKSALGAFAALLGMCWFAHWVLASIDLTAISNPLMAVVVIFGPIWTAWLGVILLRSERTGPA
ncbi:MAG: hypothetical protein AAGG55_07835 [Pseudomonadota bacterium]